MQAPAPDERLSAAAAGAAPHCGKGGSG